MGRYLARRLLIAIPSLLGISVILFTVLALAPSLLLSLVLMRLSGQRYRRAQVALHEERTGPGGAPAPASAISHPPGAE